MEAYLKQLARTIYERNQNLEQLTLIFPNRRAALYFRKHLADIIDKPIFTPRLITIEDFISSFTDLKIPDKLELVHRLHIVYNQEVGLALENFDEFYFWGDMLLRDFDEIDKYLISAEQLFRDLRNQKELDSGFDYLTEEQRNFLMDFWRGFEGVLTDNKQKFIHVWGKLFHLYEVYRNTLWKEGLAYEGMVHRHVADNLASIAARYDPAHVWFIGFNALTKVEERIISYFVESGSKMSWDADEYYVNNRAQEAGEFIREYQEHAVLKQTFTENFPSHFRSNKSITVLGAAQPIGQAKLMCQVLKQQLEKGLVPEDTLIVLPDEKLLMPVLYGIPSGIDKLNVTMGYSLGNTSFFNLIELLVELQMASRNEYHHHRQVLALLSHPYLIAADPVAANTKRKEILNHNWIQIPKSYLATMIPLHRMVFGEVEAGLLSYLRSILQEIGTLDSVLDLDREFAFHFIRLINRMQDVIGFQQQPEDRKEWIKSLKSFLRLLRQLARLDKIPFSGEPLKGLQIMGVLETRNLDYKNVFILSLNEGVFPAFSGKGSYLPYNIRRAYSLPTTEHQDAIYAYLFYRVLQRAENIFLFYNTETDPLGQGEKSRYLQQLIFESGLKLEKVILHNTVRPVSVQPILINKDEAVLEAIHKLNTGTPRFMGISPSALSTYLDCRLRFYFKHVARIREPKEVEDELGARELGNFLHRVMEWFYKDLATKKRNNRVEAGDFSNLDDTINKLIDHAFMTTYNMDPGKKVDYSGQGVVIHNLVKSFAERILTEDRDNAPFTMEAVELEGLLHRVKINCAPGFAVIGGKIDRVDRKDGLVRIVDYKTGSDKLNFESVESLFKRDKKRNKAAFQALLYAFLYQTNRPLAPGDQLKAGIINREYLFAESQEFGLRMDDQPIEDVQALLDGFKTHLVALLEEIFSPDTSFDQTSDVEVCKTCPYKNICYR